MKHQKEVPVLVLCADLLNSEQANDLSVQQPTASLKPFVQSWCQRRTQTLRAKGGHWGGVGSWGIRVGGACGPAASAEAPILYIQDCPVSVSGVDRPRNTAVYHVAHNL